MLREKRLRGDNECDHDHHSDVSKNKAEPCWGKMETTPEMSLSRRDNHDPITPLRGKAIFEC